YAIGTYAIRRKKAKSTGRESPSSASCDHPRPSDGAPRKLRHRLGRDRDVSPLPPQPVEAPGAPADQEEGEEEEAVHGFELAAIDGREEAPRQTVLHDEECDRHLARHEEGGPARIDAERQADAADDLDRAREADQRQHGEILRLRPWEAEIFREP